MKKKLDEKVQRSTVKINFIHGYIAKRCKYKILHIYGLLALQLSIQFPCDSFATTSLFLSYYFTFFQVKEQESEWHSVL